MTEQALTYRNFRAGDTEIFARLNEEWITTFFVMEDEDHNVLFHPEREILARGGHIFFVSLGTELGSETVGCCALIFIEPGVYELAKMAVQNSFRGRGIGRHLLRHVLEECRALGARKLLLQTNSRLENAIHLYLEAGFRHIPQIAAHQYARADVTMELDLGQHHLSENPELPQNTSGTQSTADHDILLRS
jgi:putative acetyltransferase